MEDTKLESKVLIQQVDIPSKLSRECDEGMWVHVIQKMDAIYADLVQHQVELEEKNQTLENTYRELHQTHEELKRTQRQLIQSEKMASLGRLVAGVAHELNNPSSFVTGNIHALEKYSIRFQHFFDEVEKLNDERIRKLRLDSNIDRVLTDLVPLIEGTKEGTQRISEIVDNLLRFTSPQEQVPEHFDLSNLVKTSVQWVTKADNRKININFEIPSSIELFGYEILVHQILVNLVHNAVDACEQNPNPTLWMSLTKSNSNAIVSVRDNGTGIKRENLQHIFDPFFTTKYSGKGTGLGLYISYLLVSEHCDGSLEAENHASGGAVFTLTLPLTINKVQT